MGLTRRAGVVAAAAAGVALGGCVPGGPGEVGPSSVGVVDHVLRSAAAPDQPPRSSERSQYVSQEDGPTGTTFGFPLCSVAPGAVITAVRPVSTTGRGFTVVGIRLATFRPEDGLTLASSGYPPRRRPGETVTPAVGATPRRCSDATLQSEVQVGLRRADGATGSDGGGWTGTFVDYTVGGRTLTLEIPYGMLLCGRSNAPC